MLIPNTRLFAAGDVLTGTMLNQTVSSMGNFLLGKPIAFLYQSAVTTTVATTATAITFDAEVIDRDNGHSTSTQTSRYTAATPGYYRVAGTLVLATNSNLVVTTYITKNGTGNPVTGSYNRFRTATAIASDFSVNTATTLVYLNGSTDYIEMVANVGTTATATLISTAYTSSLAIEWVSL